MSASTPRLVVPLPGSISDVTTVEVTSALLTSGELGELTRDLGPVRKRLRRVLRNRRFRWTLHVGPEAVVLSRRAHVGPIPVARIRAVLPRGDHRSPATASLVRAACRHHKAPVALVAGDLVAVTVGGVPIPERVRDEIRRRRRGRRP